MTTKDKTGDQLMASIRKAKTEGTTPDPAASDAKAAAPAAKPAPAAGATPPKRPRATKKKVAARPKPAAKPATPSKTVAAQGSYQSTGRVWPD